MTHSNLTVEVQGNQILVVLRGTCFRAKYRKQDAPWLALVEHGPDDPGAAITFSEFRSLAWAAANEAAHQLGWIKSCDELHRAAKRVGSSSGAPIHSLTGREAEASTYGAATSLVLLLIWVYYSAQILFLGAQFAQTSQYGARIPVAPTLSAVPRNTNPNFSKIRLDIADAPCGPRKLLHTNIYFACPR